MTYGNILVPVDFTPAAQAAVDLAVKLAVRGRTGVTLLHIDTAKRGPDAADSLKVIADKVSAEKGINCTFKVRRGSIFSAIPLEASAAHYSLMIIGSHGFKGLREKFFGSDILRLVKDIPIPVVVIRENYQLPEEGIGKIVFPASTHKAFSRNVEAAIEMARLFGSEIHLYTVQKPGQAWSADLKDNIELAMKAFQDHDVQCTRVNEEQKVYSAGYAKQTLKYAREAGAQLIAVMANPSEEHFYIADSDKELLLTNDAGIPLLLTTDKRPVA
jgi:nucleotide-binding universal stress UspA family protein